MTKHEIDVLAKCPEGNIVVECKDMSHVPKIMVDQFIQKFRDLQELGVAHAGAFVISKYESESEVSRYSEYLQKYGIVFLDANDLDQLWDNFKTHLDPLRFKEELKQLFGLAGLPLNSATGRSKTWRWGKPSRRENWQSRLGKPC